MNIDELAAELFDLIVVKGRKAVERYGSSPMFGDTYAELPEWGKDAWRVSARNFAKENYFTLDVVDETVVKVGDRIQVDSLPRFSHQEKQDLFGKKGEVVIVGEKYIHVRLDDGRYPLFLPDEIHKLYTCERCSSKSEHYLADKVTHNQYHDDVDAGRPSRFASDIDWNF